MPSKNRRIDSSRLSRLWISTWTIIWLTAIPLFHIHLPDISNTQAAQVGVAHTVFSPDLQGEYSRFSNAKPEHPFPQLLHWVFNSPELGFVLSEDTKDREKGKPLALGVRGSLHDLPFMRPLAIESRSRYRLRPAVATLRCPRAPPSVVSS